MHCAFVLADIVRDKSIPRPHLVHAGVGVAWVKCGRGVDKVRRWECKQMSSKRMAKKTRL